jgi:hypothetical protein
MPGALLHAQPADNLSVEDSFPAMQMPRRASQWCVVSISRRLPFVTQ